MPGSPDGRPARTSRLDVGVATAMVMVSFAAGAAAQPHVDLPWDRSGPAMADKTAASRLVLAQQAVQELQVTRETTQSRLAEEQLTQASELIEADRANATDAERLNHRIYDREVLMEALRMRLSTAVAAQVPADRELQVASEEMKDSQSAAADRIGWAQHASQATLTIAVWAVVALGLAVIRRCRPGRKRFVHGRVVLVGSLLGVVLGLLMTTTGWLTGIAVAAVLAVGWILQMGRTSA